MRQPPSRAEAKLHSDARSPTSRRGFQVLMAFAIFAATFTLLAWPWPGVKHAYTRAYCALGNLVLPTFGEHGRAEFVTVDLPKADVEIKLRNLRTGGGARVGINTRQTAYVPTALVAALVLATPVCFKRRAWGLLWGLLAANAFVVIRTALVMLNIFGGNENVTDLATFDPPWIVAWVINAAFVVLGASAAGGFVAPVFIWALVMVRKSDWTRAFAGMGTLPAARVAR